MNRYIFMTSIFITLNYNHPYRNNCHQNYYNHIYLNASDYLFILKPYFFLNIPSYCDGTDCNGGKETILYSRAGWREMSFYCLYESVRQVTFLIRILQFDSLTADLEKLQLVDSEKKLRLITIRTFSARTQRNRLR